MTPGITSFGTTGAAEPVHRIVIANGGLSAALLTLGVALQDVRLAGVAHSLTVGSPALAPYESAMATCGTIMGPIANRIGGASAVIDGKTCHFDANLNGRHTLHGGAGATHSRVWTLTDHGPHHAEFELHLADGAHGFPGNRTLTARYDIDAAATLRLTLTATTDAPTLMNLANHSYWRLAGAPTFSGQRLQIAADHYLPASAGDMLPTGTIAPAENTRFDYRAPRALRAGAEGLIDTNFCLSRARRPLREVARLRAQSGLTLTLSTTEPGLQVFDGHILDLPGIAGNDGVPNRAYAGLALEPQFWPDAPNHPDFPPILMRPTESWQQITTWAFSGPV